MTDSETSPKILSVGKFFDSDEYQRLVVPAYQRPYEWTQKHVRTLLNDLCNFLHEPSLQYRLGCIILYKNKDGKLEIVDGQQRLVTLWLIRRWLQLSDELADAKDAIAQMALDKVISKNSIQNACLAIKAWFSEHADASKHADASEKIAQLLSRENEKGKKAELVILQVDNLEEAFQLFDSQNSRGKPLAVHNYLKARHLGCMSSEEVDQAVAFGLLDDWDSQDDADELKILFDRLFKICEWSRRRTRTHLTIDNMDRYFYGFSENKNKFPYPYQKHYHPSTSYFEIGRQFRAGEEFFWMVKHFRYLSRQIDEYCFAPKGVPSKPSDWLKHFFEELERALGEPSHWAKNQLSRCANLFYAAAISYSNRFGLDSLKENQAILLAWSLSLRYAYQRIQDETLDDFAVGYKTVRGLSPLSVFERISEAVAPDFLLDIKQSSAFTLISYNELEKELKSYLKHIAPSGGEKYKKYVNLSKIIKNKLDRNEQNDGGKNEYE